MNDLLEASPPKQEIEKASPKGEVLVRANGVGKKFCRDLKKSLFYGLKDVCKELNPFAGSSSESATATLRNGEFWANRDISFELRRGECLGLVGRNGAGKTTLLKMLNGLIKPDTGVIEMRGRVGALIALGAGFNPILTGRENVYVNGSILGLDKKEIDDKLEDIIDFSEIREFIDSPVQSYSSGMQVRLGFAVATALKPDILILDEVLAVGDFAFRQKCLRRVSELISDCAVIFVSHNFEQLERICTSGLLLERGECKAVGELFEIRRLYDEMGPEVKGETWTMDGLEIRHDEAAGVVADDAGLKVRIRLEATEDIKDVACRIRFQDHTGEYVAGYHSNNHGESLMIPKGDHWFEVAIPEPPLKRGKYGVDIFLNHAENDMIKVLEAKRLFSFESHRHPFGFDSVQF